MPDYKKLYFTLFNGISDCLKQLNQHNYGAAKALLVKVQQEAEERYISEEAD